MEEELRMQQPLIFIAKLCLIIVFIVSMIKAPYALAHGCNEKLDYLIEKRPDGGYKLSIKCIERSFKPITSEGFFPKRETFYEVAIVGKGKDLSYRKHDGYYYSIDEVISPSEVWDLGYVWVDKKRENIFLNLYWLSTPDGLTKSKLYGKYKIK
jgi:hypothetical protein